jgi:hypothetical protein
MSSFTASGRHSKNKAWLKAYERGELLASDAFVATNSAAPTAASQTHIAGHRSGWLPLASE